MYLNFLVKFHVNAAAYSARSAPKKSRHCALEFFVGLRHEIRGFYFVMTNIKMRCKTYSSRQVAP